jgi:hypothetical protein
MEREGVGECARLPAPLRMSNHKKPSVRAPGSFSLLIEQDVCRSRRSSPASSPPWPNPLVTTQSQASLYLVGFGMTSRTMS